ncbi:MAG: fibronectin type III domain-containing protein, partial [Gammaproteobacteria bacterium]
MINNIVFRLTFLIVVMLLASQQVFAIGSVSDSLLTPPDTTIPVGSTQTLTTYAVNDTGQQLDEVRLEYNYPDFVTITNLKASAGATRIQVDTSRRIIRFRWANGVAQNQQLWGSFDFSSNNSGNYNITVRRIRYYINGNRYNHTGNSAAIHVVSDSIPPSITNIASSAISGNSATITWDTNEAADSQVEYGTSTNFGNFTPVDNALVTNHSLTVTGLSPTTTYYYRVISKDAAGNAGTSYTYTFTTGDTTAPVISNVTVSNIMTNGASVTWNTNELADSQVEYGVDTNYGSFTTLYPIPSTYHSHSLLNLTANTTYHYRVINTDEAGNTTTSPDYTFTTKDILLGITNVTASNITDNAATITWTTNKPADSKVAYGLTSALANVTPVDTALVTTHSVTITGLSPSRIYYYRAYSTDGGGSSTNGSVLSFVTPAAADTTPPVITNQSVSGITTFNAYVTWVTDEPTSGQIEYGLDTTYGSLSTLLPTYTLTHGLTLSPLVSGTTYHYRIISQDAAGNTTTSPDYSFTTLDTTAPLISGQSAASITGTGATIIWDTNEASDSIVAYGTTMSLGSSTLLDTTMVTNHSVAISGLAQTTSYYYQVTSKDAAGNAVTGNMGSFTTLDTIAPVISNVTVSNIMTNGASITWNTNELADSQVEYGVDTN